MTALKKLITAINTADIETVRLILDANDNIANQKDDSGATPLHYAAFNGNQSIVLLLVERGAEINSIDREAGATPAGWAIEYLREQGAYLAIELADLAFAIQSGDEKWTARFLERFPGLRDTNHFDGKSFKQLAEESGNENIIAMFQL